MFSTKFGRCFWKKLDIKLLLAVMKSFLKPSSGSLLQLTDSHLKIVLKAAYNM
jgi:hypothetical protein